MGCHLKGANIEAELLEQLLLERFHLFAVIVTLALELDQVRLAIRIVRRARQLEYRLRDLESRPKKAARPAAAAACITL